MLKRLCVAYLLFLSIVPVMSAQNNGTGLYAFGSFDSKGFDTINLGNLNTHFEIPIVTKSGRGVPFDYVQTYDGMIWSPVSAGYSSYWTPDASWGFHGQLNNGLTGYMSFFSQNEECTADDGTAYWNFSESNFSYHDEYGRVHPFNFQLSCEQWTGDGTSPDGSGYTFDGGPVRRRDGTNINVPWVNLETTTDIPSGSGSITDPNGNEIVNNGNGTFTDTTGTTALSITGSGTASSPIQFTYSIPQQPSGATSATATVYYKTYTVQTNFGCSGISEYGPTSVDLVDHITLGDSSTTYTFSYEPTPGNSGNVTGRLASIVLPGGGVINYSYSGGCSGTGINTDGTAAVLARTTSDGRKTYS